MPPEADDIPPEFDDPTDEVGFFCSNLVFILLIVCGLDQGTFVIQRPMCINHGEQKNRFVFFQSVCCFENVKESLSRAAIKVLTDKRKFVHIKPIKTSLTIDSNSNEIGRDEPF